MALDANAYANAAELAAELGIPDQDDDLRLESALNVASRDVDAWCGTRFWADETVQTRVYRPTASLLLDTDDISTLTGLVVEVDTNDDGTFNELLTVDEHYFLGPDNVEQMDPARPWSEIYLTLSAPTNFPTSHQRPAVQVTAKFGWPAIPAAVKQATLIQAKTFYKATSGSFAGFQLAVDVGAVMRTPALDPVAAGLLAPFRTDWVA